MGVHFSWVGYGVSLLYIGLCSVPLFLHIFNELGVNVFAGITDFVSSPVFKELLIVLAVINMTAALALDWQSLMTHTNKMKASKSVSEE
jgi:hypothetical protein